MGAPGHFAAAVARDWPPSANLEPRHRERILALSLRALPMEAQVLWYVEGSDRESCPAVDRSILARQFNGFWRRRAAHMQGRATMGFSRSTPMRASKRLYSVKPAEAIRDRAARGLERIPLTLKRSLHVEKS